MDKETKQEVVKRLSIASGHAKRIADMVEKDRYCIDVLQQTEAVKGALKKTEEIILDSHLHTCVSPTFNSKKGEEPMRELLEVFKRRQ